MNLNQLKCFCALARTEHVTQTAEDLSMAQSSLSRLIANLEEELGCPLFEKRGRNVTLTTGGRCFYEYVSRGLSEIDLGVQFIKSSVDQDGGVIEFAFIYALTPNYIPERIREFRRQHPGVSFRFYQANSKNILPRIRDGSYDLGLCSWMEGQPDLDFYPLVKQEYVLVAAASHPLARKSSVTLREAASCDFILPLDRTSFVETLFREEGLSPHVTSRVEEDHASAALVSTGLGCAILPKNPALDYYHVRQIPFAPKPVFRTFYLVRKKNRELSPAAERFCRFLKEK